MLVFVNVEFLIAEIWFRLDMWCSPAPLLASFGDLPFPLGAPNLATEHVAGAHITAEVIVFSQASQYPFWSLLLAFSEKNGKRFTEKITFRG